MPELVVRPQKIKVFGRPGGVISPGVRRAFLFIFKEHLCGKAVPKDDAGMSSGDGPSAILTYQEKAEGAGSTVLHFVVRCYRAGKQPERRYSR